MSELLFSGEHIECHYKEQASDWLLITGNEMGMIAGGGRFWADGLAQKLGVSAAGFITRTPNWFPQIEMITAINALNARIAGRYNERVAYGHSQGGYMALKYGAALGATTAICFCPQISIDPSDIKDRRFNRFFVKDIHEGMKIKIGDASGNIFLFFDPFDVNDRQHLDLICEVVRVSPITVRSSGHASVRVFANAETARALFNICRANDQHALLTLTAENRRRFKDRVKNLVDGIIGRHPLLAIKIMNSRRSEIHARHWAAICFKLASQGYAADAVRFMEEALEMLTDDVEVNVALGWAQLKLGQPAMALHRFHKALEGEPTNEKYRWLVSEATKSL